MDRCVVLDNLPQTDKVDKITNLMKNLLTKIGPITKMQYDPKGFMFCQFETIQQAKNAVKKVDNYALDKVHTLKVNFLTDIQLAQSDPVMPVDPLTLPDNEVEVEASTPLNNWMFDSRDQYAILKGDTTEVAWFKSPAHQSRPKWSEAHIKWSPLGTYLVSVHAQGIVLSGDTEFKRVHHYTHPGVKLFDISQDEKFLTSWSPFPHPDSGHNLFLWDLDTGVMLKSFNADPSIAATTNSTSTMNIGTIAQPVQFPWPVLHFSPDSKYCARQTTAGITMYMLPTMQFQKFKIENVTEWSFSPSTPTLLMYSQQADGDVPSRTTILSLSEKPDPAEPWTTVLKSRSLFNITTLNTVWHPKSKYLLQYMSRKKTKTTFTSTIEIYRLKEKTCPVDVLDAQNNVTDMKFSFEDKVALIGSGELRIYELIKNMFTLKDTFTSKCQYLAYACTGFLAAWSGSQLEFYDSGLLRQVENNGTIEWDERGRYAAAVTKYLLPDSGFTVYDCSGAQLVRQTLPLFKQFMWRPRGGDLLSDETKAAIEEKRSTWSSTFESEDRRKGKEGSQEREQGRKDVWKKWIEFRKLAAANGFVSAPRPSSFTIGICTIVDYAVDAVAAAKV